MRDIMHWGSGHPPLRAECARRGLPHIPPTKTQSRRLSHRRRARTHATDRCAFLLHVTLAPRPVSASSSIRTPPPSSALGAGSHVPPTDRCPLRLHVALEPRAASASLSILTPPPFSTLGTGSHVPPTDGYPLRLHVAPEPRAASASSSIRTPPPPSALGAGSHFPPTDGFLLRLHVALGPRAASASSSIRTPTPLMMRAAPHAAESPPKRRRWRPSAPHTPIHIIGPPPEAQGGGQARCPDLPHAACA
ncbi:hypothetical protein DFH09DRAFT_1436704 [Mycena vulgaris]|nr:hypothetical protein DFH09DRAFT_1436704 [Mycena vulgaris]